MPIAQTKPQESDFGENPASNPRAVLGGNEPPLEDRIQMEFRDALIGERPDFIQRMEDSIAAVDRAEVNDDDTLGRAGTLANILRACENHISEVHVAVKKPYLDGGRICDAEKRRLTDPVTSARATLSNKMNAFLAEREAQRRAEERRLAEEQARQAAEAAAAIAEGAAPEDVAPMAAAVAKKAEPVRSDEGAIVSTRTVWNSQVEDYTKAFKAVKSDPKVREAIDAAIARLVRAGQRDIAGVKIWDTVAATTR